MLERVGKYQIKRELGKGTRSTVYLAYDEFYGSDVAVKVYDDEGQSPEARVPRVQFLSEAALAGKLIHPHIVTILDAVVEERFSYVAMEYVHGGNLYRFTSPERLLPVADVVEIAFKCCGALDYAYRQGVVHRDIKPANILVARGTDVKVADFGAAFVRDAETTQKLRIGSPSYVAPEQIRDDPLTHQSDMYSLGVVLYELLVGRRPFYAGNMEELLAMVLGEDPVRPSVWRPELPEELDVVVQRMLCKYPQERYPDWAELALELARIGHLSVYDQAIRDSEKFLALRPAALLTQLSDADLWELTRIGQWRRVPSQTVLLNEGKSGDSLFILARGEAKVTARGRLLNVLRAGECFGEMAYARDQAASRQATVETSTDALVVELTRSALDGLSIGCQLQLNRALLRALADRLELANVRLTPGG
ncbi:MAG TPA: serine/threonine-protein kinase [Burkholderiales bacterium]|nr:serine/threonine-protein kinase [Burkholderiales bacterium]